MSDKHLVLSQDDFSVAGKYYENYRDNRYLKEFSF